MSAIEQLTPHRIDQAVAGEHLYLISPQELEDPTIRGEFLSKIYTEHACGVIDLSNDIEQVAEEFMAQVSDADFKVIDEEDRKHEIYYFDGSEKTQIELKLEHLSRMLGGENARPVNMFVSRYSPGDRFDFHIDLPGDPLEGFLPVEALSVIYPLYGSKAFEFKDENGVTRNLQQQPGQVLIFRGASLSADNSDIMQGVEHRVPETQEYSAMATCDIMIEGK